MLVFLTQCDLVNYDYPISWCYFILSKIMINYDFLKSCCHSVSLLFHCIDSYLYLVLQTEKLRKGTKKQELEQIQNSQPDRQTDRNQFILIKWHVIKPNKQRQEYRNQQQRFTIFTLDIFCLLSHPAENLQARSQINRRVFTFSHFLSILFYNSLFGVSVLCCTFFSFQIFCPSNLGNVSLALEERFYLFILAGFGRKKKRCYTFWWFNA